MRPVSAWAHMMSSQVQIQDQTGVDGYGKPTFGLATTYKGHLGNQRAIVRTVSGQVVDSRQALWLDASIPVQLTSKITLSTGDVGSTEAALVTPPIVSIARLNDQGGPHHTVVYF